MTTADEVTHEGPRVFAQGKGLWRTIAELYGYFVAAGLVLTLLGDASLTVSLAISIGCATVLSAWCLLVSRGGVRISRSEVRVGGWRGTTVVPGSEIAQVVHIKDLVAMGTIQGYVALLDRDGRPLWRSATNHWRPETVRVLVGTGQRRAVVPTMRSQDAARQWPHLLPWSLAHPMKAFWTTVVAMLVFFAVLAVVLHWLFSGPLAAAPATT